MLNFESFFRLLTATPTGDNPVDLLVNAGQIYVPLNPSVPVTDLAEDEKLAQNLDERPSVNEVIANFSASIWYKDQIVSRRTIQVKEAQTC